MSPSPKSSSSPLLFLPGSWTASFSLPPRLITPSPYTQPPPQTLSHHAPPHAFGHTRGYTPPSQSSPYPSSLFCAKSANTSSSFQKPYSLFQNEYFANSLKIRNFFALWQNTRVSPTSSQNSVLIFSEASKGSDSHGSRNTGQGSPSTSHQSPDLAFPHLSASLLLYFSPFCGIIPPRTGNTHIPFRIRGGFSDRSSMEFHGPSRRIPHLHLHRRDPQGI